MHNAPAACFLLANRGATRKNHLGSESNSKIVQQGTGGCFFAAPSFEFDSRKGPVRDAIAKAMQEWLSILRGPWKGPRRPAISMRTVNSEQFAFEIYSLSIGAHWGFQFAGRC
jgi:hypothetical protein